MSKKFVRAVRRELQEDGEVKNEEKGRKNADEEKVKIFVKQTKEIITEIRTSSAEILGAIRDIRRDVQNLVREIKERRRRESEEKHKHFHERYHDEIKVLTKKVVRASVEHQVRASIEAETQTSKGTQKVREDYAGGGSWGVADKTTRSRRKLKRREEQRRKEISRAEGGLDKRKEDEMRRARKKARWWEFPAPGPPDSAETKGCGVGHPPAPSPELWSKVTSR